MIEPAARTNRNPLVSFADYLESQQAVITDRWLLTVRRDSQIETADRIPTPELVDHLPPLLGELCDFLRTRDVENLAGDARRDASQHGELRWRDGYKIDELVRELEALRQLVASFAFRYRDMEATFNGPLEASASALVQQFFAEITIISVRQFMSEQEHVTRSCLQQLAEVRQELGRASSELSQVRDRQHRVTTVVAHELRHILRKSMPPADSAGTPSTLAALFAPLLEYIESSNLPQHPVLERFDPRTLFSEIVSFYKPIAERKGLQLLTQCLTAPESVLGDRARVGKIAQLLLENAIEHTQAGRVSFGFSTVDGDVGRWAIIVNDTGPGLSEEDSAQVFSGNPVPAGLSPGRGVGLIMAKDLAHSLGASLQTKSQTGVGTQIEVSFPI